MNRRKFAKGALLTPIAIALEPSAFSQQASAAPQNGKAKTSAPALHKPKSDSAYNKPLPIHELEPFAEELVFTRKEFAPKLQPFARGEVQLDPGPFQQSREWNRGYMMRLPKDRLLYNFRMTADI